jgi:hypothetical protein
MLKKILNAYLEERAGVMICTEMEASIGGPYRLGCYNWEQLSTSPAGI